mgnify:CR=1 FL=1
MDFDSGSVGFNRYIVTNFQVIRGSQYFRHCTPQRLTGSMEDTINTGDLIFCEVTNDPSYEYKKGDIVTFYKEINGNSELNTHRIVEVVKDDNITYYRTQGDNRKLTLSPMKNFKLLHLLSPNTQVRRLAAWVTF